MKIHHRPDEGTPETWWRYTTDVMKVHQRPDEGTHQVCGVPSSDLWCTFIMYLVYLHRVSGVPSSGIWCTFIKIPDEGTPETWWRYTRDLMKVHKKPDEGTQETWWRYTRDLMKVVRCFRFLAPKDLLFIWLCNGLALSIPDYGYSSRTLCALK
jgi:L-rhamnose mutarotase